MTKNYYDLKYFQAHDYLDLHLAESIKIFMADNYLKKILDVGCGTGKIVQFLNQNGFESYGCDKNGLAVKMARQVNRDKSIIKASATSLPFENSSFDLITALSVIEHLKREEIKKFLQEANRVLKPCGFIFLITPNFSSPLKYILREKWLGHSDPTHITLFTPKSLLRLLKDFRFTHVQFRFKSAYTVSSDLHLPKFLRALPVPLKNIFNYLVVSSPFAILRDNLWVAAQKI